MSAVLSDETASAMLQAVAGMIDSGGRPGVMQICEDGRVLAVLPFRHPSGLEPQDGVLHFRPLQEDPAAQASGTANTARIRNSEGLLIMTLDVGDERSNAGVKLNPTTVRVGQPVRIYDFKLSFKG